MNIVEIMVKNIPFEDGRPSLTCWVRTDSPYADGETGFACGHPFPEEGQAPGDVAEILRWMAACIETMSVRPRPKLTIVK